MIDHQAIARELHDNIAQSLAAVNLQLQAMLELSEYPRDATHAMLVRAHTTARTANAELRRLIDDLRAAALNAQHEQAMLSPLAFESTIQTRQRRVPAASTGKSASADLSLASQKLVAIDRLRRLGLVVSLSEYFQSALGSTIALDFHHKDYQAQSLAIEVELFRIAQEAVSNAIRHGQASEVHIFLSVQQQLVSLRIEDNGHAKPNPAPEGVGLKSMHARAQRFGGHMRLERSALGGIAIQVQIPAN